MIFFFFFGLRHCVSSYNRDCMSWNVHVLIRHSAPLPPNYTSTVCASSYIISLGFIDCVTWPLFIGVWVGWLSWWLSNGAGQELLMEALCPFVTLIVATKTSCRLSSGLHTLAFFLYNILKEGMRKSNRVIEFMAFIFCVRRVNPRTWPFQLCAARPRPS